MSNLVPVGRKALKLGVKYGPQAKIAWDTVGKDAVEQAKARRSIAVAKRHAIEKARTLTDGWVLRQIDGEQVVWVVFAGEEPVTSYPPLSGSLDELLRGADLSKRLTPAEYDARRARARAARTAARARQVVRRRRGGGPAELEG